jgi:hypothetical protein
MYKLRSMYQYAHILCARIVVMFCICMNMCIRRLCMLAGSTACALGKVDFAAMAGTCNDVDDAVVLVVIMLVLHSLHP